MRKEKGTTGELSFFLLLIVIIGVVFLFVLEPEASEERNNATETNIISSPTATPEQPTLVPTITPDPDTETAE